jgi:superfamily II DNA/RNA helicase
MKSFKDFNLTPSVLDQINKLGFKEPTPIQDKSIPYILSGRDVLGSAGTGTGKTGAFGIPLIEHLLSDTSNAALVLLPTRELALQVVRALQDFIGKSTKLQAALIIGGEDMGRQIRELKASPKLVVGTPGRINDHLKRGTLNLKNVNFLVLDEMDRMLDMGFGVQLEAIAKYMTAERQTVMFSATMPKDIKRLAEKYLNDPITVSIESSNKSPTNIKQEEVTLNQDEKYPHLVKELGRRSGTVIIFIKTKYSAEAMAKKLRRDGHEAESFHGDLRQNKRNKVISRFRRQDYRILVATDIASRGLDIPHIEHVINYDLPQCPEDYIHRIGRTARAGASGNALNFLSRSDSKKWDAIQRMLDPNAKIPLAKNKSRENPRRAGRPVRGKPNFSKDKPHASRGNPNSSRSNPNSRAPRGKFTRKAS